VVEAVVVVETTDVVAMVVEHISEVVGVVV
jgi:hypothetical protein